MVCSKCVLAFLCQRQLLPSAAVLISAAWNDVFGGCFEYREEEGQEGGWEGGKEGERGGREGG